MNAFSRVRILTKGNQGKNFDVMKAFSELDSVRKMALFDRLNDSRKTFYKTVTLFWPQAKPTDAKQLERFMAHSIAANDA